MRTGAATGFFFRLGESAARPVSGQSLAVFRIAFGLLMLVDVIRLLEGGWVTLYYVERDILFPYYGFGIPPLPTPWLHWLWALCGLCCLLVALGAFYRLAIWGYNAIFIYFFLLDQTTYLNHFYMIALFGLLLGLTDAHRLWSVDRRLGRVRGAPEIPRWNLLILQFQIEVVLILDSHKTVEAALAAPDRAARAGDGRGWPAPKAGWRIVIEERSEGAAIVLSLGGRLDGPGARMLEARIAAIVDRGATRVVLDCSAMNYINSAGLRALLVCARACREKGGRLVIAALTSECRSIVGMSGFLTVIDHHVTRAAAVAALA